MKWLSRRVTIQMLRSRSSRDFATARLGPVEMLLMQTVFLPHQSFE